MATPIDHVKQTNTTLLQKATFQVLNLGASKKSVTFYSANTQNCIMEVEGLVVFTWHKGKMQITLVWVFSPKKVVLLVKRL